MRINSSIAIFGKIPPPYGGVTVHIYRFINRLRAKGIPYTLYETGGKSDPKNNIAAVEKSIWGLLKFLLTVKEQFTHLHTNRIIVICLAALVIPMRGRKVIFTLHSEKPMRWYENANIIAKKLFSLLIRRSRAIICVNSKIMYWLEDIGINREQLLVAPAFVTPTDCETNEANLTTEMVTFLHEHNPVIGSHGWFGFFIDGIHVYSFDMIARVFKNLRESYPNLGLYTIISETYEPQHRQAIYDLRKNMNAEQDWLIIEKPFCAASLYKKSNLFVRPTITDGDSVSIRECLSMNVPVVASDAVFRPPGCKLFKNRDYDDFLRVILETLINEDTCKSELSQVKDYDETSKVIQLYEELLKV